MISLKHSQQNIFKKIGFGSAMIAASGTGFVQCSTPQENEDPNIVIIFTDDQGYADVGCYGAKGFETPNIDRLAEQGVRFTNFYASQAVSSASRASLLTGCYSNRVGILGALMPWSNIGINPEETTIAEMLKDDGYSCGIFGKWHLGHHKEFLPLQHGFDEYLGLPYSNDMWPVDFDGTMLTKENPGKKTWKLRYPQLPLIDGNEKVDEIRTLEDQATLTTRYTERAVEFIKKNKDNQFFLYVPHSMPHVPLGVSDKFNGKSEQGMYGDVIMEIDWSVGEILKTLKESGLEENTLVIFATDNGPWMNFGNHAGSALPLREGKGAMWEGGPRVPCIMKWPGKIPAGKVCNNIAATIDILPTLSEITGAELPEKAIDGVSILSLMKGEENANPREEYYFFYGKELRAVRKGKWKLYFPHEYRSYKGVEPGMDGFPGPYAKGKCGTELYNLENDISETNDVFDENPEIVKELTLVANEARRKFGDALTGVRAEEARECGNIGGQTKYKVKNLAKGKSITLKNKFSPKYTGTSDDALIDGIRATSIFADGCWQGFQKDDLIATIDLGEETKIKKIICGFLSNEISWIFLPKKVEVFISNDNKNFELIKIFGKNKDKENRILPKITDYITKLPEPKRARFIRIKAENIEYNPEWHTDAGGKSWIFADEIIVN